MQVQKCTRTRATSAALPVISPAPPCFKHLPEASADKSRCQSSKPCRHVCAADAARSMRSANISDAAVPPVLLSVSLPADEILKSVQFATVAEGRGQALVVVSVAPGSEAAQAGLGAGQKLVGISDPMRNGVMWQLKDRPSQRFVREALRMRRSQNIDLELQKTDIRLYPSSLEPYVGSTTSMASVDDESTAQVIQPPATEVQPQQPLTVGEQLAQQYAEAAAASQGQTDVQKRIARRKSYLEEVSKRNDSGFGLFLLSFFIVPPAVVLLAAWASGYLDSLYSNSLLLR